MSLHHLFCLLIDTLLCSRGGSILTPKSWEPDLFAHLGSRRLDPDLLVSDPEGNLYPSEDPDPFMDPDLSKKNQTHRRITSKRV